jgi:hypothetical protein
MKRLDFTFLALIFSVVGAAAQVQKVQNKPYIDLRPFHFGILVGTHLQDIELQNVCSQLITGDDGKVTETVINTDQDRWDAGFTVGVAGELRLSTHFQLRIAPAMYFGSRHITFRNSTVTDAEGRPTERHQDLKTVYLSTATELIFSAPRFNNHRPYLLAGFNPMLNLSGKHNDYLRLKRYDVYFEVGIGCDLYLPFFKLRPELKFLFSPLNSLDKGHGKRMKDKNMLPYTLSVKEAHTKMIVLTFYFE